MKNIFCILFFLVTINLLPVDLVMFHNEQVGYLLANQRDGIFFTVPEEAEWNELEALLDGYFNRLEKEGFSNEALLELEWLLVPYRVYVRKSSLFGSYYLYSGNISLSNLLFGEGANRNFAKGILYHEKIHERQQVTFDAEALRLDRRKDYQWKLQEVSAHYLQIEYVYLKGDKRALDMTLYNSYVNGMFPAILHYYPDTAVTRLLGQYSQFVRD